MSRILLVHGAFAGSWCWEWVLPGLRAAGHDVEAIDLPGAGEDTTPLERVSLDLYAKRICEALSMNVPPLLVGHSMGGMAISQAAARCPDRVAALCYLAAFIPRDGQSLMEITKLPEAADDQVLANLIVTGEPPIATLSAEGARKAVFNCCTEEQVKWGAEHLGPQPVAVLTQPFAAGSDAAAYTRLPRAYITCLQDEAIKPALQRRMYEEAGCNPIIKIDTDHSPWLSRVDELVAALDQVANALT